MNGLGSDSIKGPDYMDDLDDIAYAKEKAKKKNSFLNKLSKLAGGGGGGGGGVVTTTIAPSISTRKDAKITITSPLAFDAGEKDSIVMEAHDATDPFIEVFKSPEAIPTKGQIGALVFAKGIAYIRTPGGIVNLGYALEHADPIFITPEQRMDKQNDRRSAILAQKEKKKNGR